MMMTRRKCLRTAAFLAAVMLTAGLPLSVKGAWNQTALTAYADEDYTYGEAGILNYKKFSDHIEITGTKSMDAASVEIPESIDNLPVTVIGIYAFQLLKAKTVTIPDSVTEIGPYTFSGCENLTEVTLPKNLKTIKFHSFENCTSLATINFPEQPVQAGDYTFDNTPWLEEQRKKDPLVIVNGAVIDGRTCKGDVKIPAGTKCIATGAFSKNENITSVSIPSSVSGFFENTFWYCSNLTSVELAGATELGFGVFGACNKLTDIKLSGKVSKIDSYTFTDNTATATITFYGSESTWNQVQKPADDEFLKRAKMVFDENHQEEEEDVIGDINKSGKCDIADAVLLARFLSAEDGVILADWKAGDMDKDGKLTAIDLTLLKKHILSK